MENFNIQTLTLLTTIVSLTATLLSISQDLKKNGFIASIRGITLCILPVLFIQQILQAVYSTKLYFGIFLLGIAIFLLILIKKKDYQFYDRSKKEDIILFSSVAIAILLFILQNLILDTFVKNYSVEMSTYITQLNKQKISIEMYVFLSDNLKPTLYVFVDLITLILLLTSLVYTIKYYIKNYHLGGYDSDIEIDEFKYLIFVFLSLIFSFGLGKLLVSGILTLF